MSWFLFELFYIFCFLAILGWILESKKMRWTKVIQFKTLVENMKTELFFILHRLLTFSTKESQIMILNIWQHWKLPPFTRKFKSFNIYYFVVMLNFFIFFSRKILKWICSLFESIFFLSLRCNSFTISIFKCLSLSKENCIIPPQIAPLLFAWYFSWYFYHWSWFLRIKNGKNNF